MGEVEDFREEFIDRYLHSQVRPIAIHDTNLSWAEDLMRMGLKAFPSKHKVIRRELGVHFHRIKPTRNGLTRGFVSKKADLFARGKARCDREDGAGILYQPGFVLLDNEIKRERAYGPEPMDAKSIYEHRYVPILPGGEKTIQTLVPRKNILDVIFLTMEELMSIAKEADDMFGCEIDILYKLHKKKMRKKRASSLLGQRDDHISQRSGWLLLYKSRDYLFSD